MKKKIAVILISLFILFGISIYLFSTKKPTEIKVANWKTYQNKDFSFKYPDDWKMTTESLDNGFINLRTTKISNLHLSSATSSANTAVSYFDYSQPGASITIQNGYILGQDRQPLSFKEIIKEKFLPTQFYGSEEIIIGNQKVQKFKNKQAGPWKNLLVFPYDGGIKNYFEISFDYSEDLNVDYYKTVFDEILKSFIFFK